MEKQILGFMDIDVQKIRTSPDVHCFLLVCLYGCTDVDLLGYPTMR